MLKSASVMLYSLSFKSVSEDLGSVPSYFICPILQREQEGRLHQPQVDLMRRAMRSWLVTDLATKRSLESTPVTPKVDMMRRAKRSLLFQGYHLRVLGLATLSSFRSCLAAWCIFPAYLVILAAIWLYLGLPFSFSAILHSEKLNGLLNFDVKVLH